MGESEKKRRKREREGRKFRFVSKSARGGNSHKMSMMALTRRRAIIIRDKASVC